MSDDTTRDGRPASPRRRKLLIAGSGLIVAGATGGVWIASRLDGREAWIEAVLRTNLPGITLEPVSLQAFIKSFAQHREFADEKSNIAVVMDQAVPAVARQIGKVDRRVERMERLAVTEYLMGSNFFRVPDPTQTTIVYTGSIPACGNPFAQFRDA